MSNEATEGRSDRERVALALAALPEGKRKRVIIEALRADDGLRRDVFAIVSYLARLPEPAPEPSADAVEGLARVICTAGVKQIRERGSDGKIDDPRYWAPVARAALQVIGGTEAALRAERDLLRAELAELADACEVGKTMAAVAHVRELLSRPSAQGGGAR